MSYALCAMAAFCLLCLAIGLPFARLLLKGAPLSSKVFLAPTLGYAALALTIEPLIRIFGPIGAWWWAVWLIVGVAGFTTFFFQRHTLIEFASRTMRDVRSRRRLVVYAAGFIVIYAGLAALPLVDGARYGIFRTNPSDANVNIAIAEYWTSSPWSMLDEYLDTWGQPEQIPAERAVAASSPIGIFSARFMSFGVREPTGMLIALHGELFRLPTYLSYWPLLLSTALITAFAAFGCLRAAGARTWVSLIIASSVVGGWAFIVREADNSNQHATLPVLIGALFLVLLRFDRGWRSRIRSGLAIAFVLAAAVSIYPEIGLTYAGALGASLVILGALQRRPIGHWITVATAAVAGGAILALNGQAEAIWGWVAYLRSGELDLSTMSGPTGLLLWRQGPAAVAGLMDLEQYQLTMEHLGWAALLGAATLVIVSAPRSYVGLGTLIFAASFVWMGARTWMLDQSLYVPARSASIVGFIAVISVATVWYAASWGRSTKRASALAQSAFIALSGFGAFWMLRELDTEIRFLLIIPAAAASIVVLAILRWDVLRRHAPRVRAVAQFVVVAFICAWSLGGLSFWHAAFSRADTGYSPIAVENPKANIPRLTLIRTALTERSNEGLGLYIPRLREPEAPWPALFFVHMVANEHDAVFLSGFMHDNADKRRQIQREVYSGEAARSREVTLLLVAVPADPIAEGTLAGEIVVAEGQFRLYEIEPTSVGQLLDVLPFEIESEP